MRTRLSSLTVAAALLAGCATNNPRDPLEPFNRAMFAFNEKVDENIAKPVAKGYVKVVPEPVRSCVGNMFSNIADVWTGVNDFLQGKGYEAINDWGRFLLNSTAGIFGCFDLASKQGVAKNREDFGQTLGKWGVGSGFYIVIPVLGPSTLRDFTAQTLVDTNLDLVWQTDPVRARNQLLLLRAIDTRANFLEAGELIGQVALDKYTFTRDAYLQRRYSLIFDGDVPEGKSYDGRRREEEEDDEDLPNENRPAGGRPAPGAPASAAPGAAPGAGAQAGEAAARPRQSEEAKSPPQGSEKPLAPAAKP